MAELSKGEDKGPRSPAPGAHAALALLLAINLFNYIDRQVLSATLPKIKLDAGIFRPDDPWLQTKLGTLTTAFLLSYMLLSPLFGWLGDKVHRWALVGVAVIAWSLATGGTGLAVGYAVLLLTRCCVGVGEAGYGPVAPSMLSDLYPVDHRGRVMSWFYMAIPVGSALGFVIGSQVADTSWQWRGAFLVVVVPGLILGSLCFLMRDPPRPHAKKDADRPGKSYFVVLREMLGIRSFFFCTAGMTASTFVLGGVASWIPVYFFEREARFTLDGAAIKRLDELKTSTEERVVPKEVVDRLKPLAGPEVMTASALQKKMQDALPKEVFRQYSSWVYDAAPAEGSITNGRIGLIFGGIVVIGGLIATLLGGMVGDWLRNRGVRGAYFHVAGWGTLVGFPCFLGILFTPTPYAWVFTFLAVFALFFNTGPANTILANVTRSDTRATAFAINILIIHALGDAISPILIGFVADQTNLQLSFLLTSSLILVAGILWVMGARHLDEDTRRVEE